jgi:hypothetical protein
VFRPWMVADQEERRLLTNGNGEGDVTVSSPEETSTAREIRVRDELGPRIITGWPLADLSWSYAEAQSYGHDRWTDMTLYRVVGNPRMRYAVQITGRSALYHRVGGPCNVGVSVPVGKLYGDEDRYDALQPCRRPGCNPKDLDHLKDDDVVRMEVDLPKLYVCRDADEAVASLYNHGRREGRGPSGLSVKLLSAASAFDKDIEQALMRMDRD